MLRVSDLGRVMVTEPILHMPMMLPSNYGTSIVDVVVPYALPSVQKSLPPKNTTVNFDKTPTPWNKNPIDRKDLPVPVVIPPEVTFTNRNKLLKMLYIFMFAPSREDGYNADLTFNVSRVGDIIYFLDGILGELPGPVTDNKGVKLEGTEGGFSVPFEKLVYANANPTVDKYFLFQSYTLLGAIDLLVRADVDCVTPDPKGKGLGQLTEIVSKENSSNPSNPIWMDKDFFRTVWAQMLFGCTESLVIGVYNPNPAGAVATFNDIRQMPFEKVADYADMLTDDKYIPPLTGLVSLLKWIRDNIKSGDNKIFSYSVDGQLFTLA